MITTSAARTRTTASNVESNATPTATEPTSLRPGRALPVAGVAYLLAWCIGLSVFSSSTDVGSSGRDVLRGLAGHTGAASLQYLLTELAAGAALAVVVVALARRLAPGRARSVLGIAGGLAAGISILQGVVGIWMCEVLVGRRDASTIGDVTRALNRADGVKMVLLAVAITALLIASNGRRSAAGPRWLRVAAMVTVPALVISTVGYLAAVDAFAAAAWISLPLLIVTVTGSALTVGRRA